MARVEVTPEMVSRAANEIRAAGGKPSVRTVLARLGSGSSTTINKHLAAWKDANPLPRQQAPEIPVDLVASLQNALLRAGAEARSDALEQLAESQQTIEDITEENGRIVAERDELAQLLSAVNSERDALRGQLEQLSSDVAAVRDSLDREQKAAEAARTEVARLQLRIEAADAIAGEHEKVVQGKNHEIGQLRDQLNAQLAATAAAEKASAVDKALLDAAAKTKTSDDGRLARMDADLRVAQALAADGRAAAATVTELREKLALLQRMLEKSEGRAAATEGSAASSGEASPAAPGKVPSKDK